MTNPLRPIGQRGAVGHLRTLFATATPFRRVQLALTLVLTALGSIAELVTIGAVLPLLAIAAAPDKAATVPVVGRLLYALSYWLAVTPIVAASLVLVASAIIATVIRLALTWISQKFVYGLQQDLVLAVYGRALRQPYGWYVRQSSSALISGLDKIYVVTVGIISPLLTAVSSGVIALAIVILLFVIDPVVATISAGSVGVVYVGISLTSKKALFIVSAGIAESRTARVKVMQETLGGIRDIILDQSQPHFEQRLSRIEDVFRRMLIISNVVALAPRIIVEGASIILVAVLAAWFSTQPGGVLHAIPVLGALALGAQRLLPMVQAVYIGFSYYSVNAHTLQDVIALLEAPVEAIAERKAGATLLEFNDQLTLENVSFSYGESEALTNIDLTIRKGDRVGLIGKTGSGKSTLVDLIMGLLTPTTGRLIVDGSLISDDNRAEWKAQIAHVPQAIFLSDDSIAANIAFGEPDAQIDHERVVEAARQAGMMEFVDELPAGMATRVGERGIRLSGGQRQRIGIARALYKRATVLVLDEATSALDSATEAAVMDAVDRLDKNLTVLIIAHRLSTLANCDVIHRLEHGRIADCSNDPDPLAQRNAQNAGDAG